MATSEANKLLHVLVVVGAGLTGGTLAAGCSSGGVSAQDAADAAADASTRYQTIQPNCANNDPSCYGRIQEYSCDVQPRPSQCYPRISPPPPPSDAGAAHDAADAADAG